MTNRKIMSQKALNGVATPVCMICQKPTSYLLSCCGHPLCESCFDEIKQHYADETKRSICSNCRKPITALIPIVPILKPNGDATGASKANTILDLPREYQPQWKHDAGSQLTIT